MNIVIKKIISFWSRAKFLVVIFITLAALMIASAIIELSQSKKDLYNLMEDQAKSLLESIMISSENSLLSNEELTTLIEERLLNNATLITHLYKTNNISNELLNEICDQNNLFRANIFDKNGKKLFYSHEQIHFSDNEKYSPMQLYYPIFTGSVDTLIIGIIPARYEPGNRFAVAVSGPDNSAIVVNIDAEKILQFRKNIGFGPLLRNIVKENPSIIFAALQDTSNILAASGNVTDFESILSSEFLSASLATTTFATRVTQFDSIEVFETVHPFNHKGRQVGLLRVGLSMEPIYDINNRIYRRLIFITIILFIIGSIIFAMLFVLQRLGILRKQYSMVETYSSNIISKASDAVIVYNEIEGIKIYNQSAEKLFNVSETSILNKQISELLSLSDLKIITESKSPIVQLSCNINDNDKILLVSRTEFLDDNVSNIILLIRDLTEQKILEEQLERNQRLTAMGELASGVAHEIRNPLNSISTIVQQLDKDFTPNDNSEEYHELSQIVYKEIKRINQTIQNFLQFARPEEIRASEFKITDLLRELDKQYSSLLAEKGITLSIIQKWKGTVNWDYNKIKQALINLIDNAADSINKSGSIIISIKKDMNRVLLTIQDNGGGINAEDQNKIFNLYYTTKASGTGIGLSIVQRIIYEHNGTISVNSEPESGTVFRLTIPTSIK